LTATVFFWQPTREQLSVQKIGGGRTSIIQHGATSRVHPPRLSRSIPPIPFSLGNAFHASDSAGNDGPSWDLDGKPPTAGAATSARSFQYIWNLPQVLAKPVVYKIIYYDSEKPPVALPQCARPHRHVFEITLRAMSLNADLTPAGRGPPQKRRQFRGLALTPMASNSSSPTSAAQSVYLLKLRRRPPEPPFPVGGKSLGFLNSGPARLPAKTSTKKPVFVGPERRKGSSSISAAVPAFSQLKSFRLRQKTSSPPLRSPPSHQPHG